MSNVFDDMNKAVAAAKTVLDAADSVSTDMAGMLSGRLRKVRYNSYLSALKRELRDWDMHRECWKEDK